MNDAQVAKRIMHQMDLEQIETRAKDDFLGAVINYAAERAAREAVRCGLRVEQPIMGLVVRSDLFYAANDWMHDHPQWQIRQVEWFKLLDVKLVEFRHVHAHMHAMLGDRECLYCKREFDLKLDARVRQLQRMR